MHYLLRVHVAKNKERNRHVSLQFSLWFPKYKSPRKRVQGIQYSTYNKRNTDAQMYEGIHSWFQAPLHSVWVKLIKRLFVNMPPNLTLIFIYSQPS